MSFILGTLEALSIPPLDLNQNLEVCSERRASPQGFGGDQSNSEDSSLSDSDRTLVGDAPGTYHGPQKDDFMIREKISGECLGLLSSHSNSPADQHMASPSDPAEDTYNHEVFGNPSEVMNWDEEAEDLPPPRSPNYYFKATMLPHASPDIFAETDSTRCCRIHVDKRMNLAKLKKHLEPIVGVPMEYFKMYRRYPHEFEWTRLTDTLGASKHGDRITIKLGRVLKKDEYAGKVYHLTPENTELFSFLFEWIVGKGQTVGQVKKEILFAAKKQHMLDIAFGKSRLRLKNWKNPCKVYLDEQKFGEDIQLSSNWEMFLQDLGEGEIVTNSNQLCLFVKRWCPSTLTLTPFHEIVLGQPTMEELKRKLGEESGVPKECVDVAYQKGTFPCDMNVLDIQNELDWNPNVSCLENWPLQVYQDGSVFLYRRVACAI